MWRELNAGSSNDCLFLGWVISGERRPVIFGVRSTVGVRYFEPFVLPRGLDGQNADSHADNREATL